MSITKEEVVDHIKEIRRILDKNGSSKKAFNGIIELEEYFNQQTTPTDIEEVLPVRCSECKYQTINEELDAGTLFGCSKKETIVYDTIGGMKFDRHHNCPLTSTPIKAEEQPVVTSRVEEALDKIYNWSGIPFVVTTNTKILEKALQDKDKKYELLKTHFEDATGWNNELTRKLQDKDNEIEKLVNETIQMIEDRLFEDRISKVEFTPLLKKLQIIKEG